MVENQKHKFLGELAATSSNAQSTASTLRVVLARLRALLAPLRNGQLYLARGRDEFRAVSTIGGRRHLLAAVRDVVPIEQLGRPVHLAPTGPIGGHVVSVPILADAILIGLIVLERDTRGFDRADTDYLVRVADQLSRLLQPDAPVEHSITQRPHPVDRRIATRARLTTNAPPPYGRRESDRRIGADMTLARHVQQLFLPSLPSFIPTGADGAGLQIAAEYHPAYEVGGDFYDFVQTGEHRFIAAVGDVSGKGVSAALVMSRREADFRRLANTGCTPGVLLGQLNTIMADEGHDAMFATALCVEIDTRSRSLAIANAGHVPIVHRPTAGPLCFIGIEAGAPLGLVPDEEYFTQHFSYAVGDIIVLMTDGISDALDPSSTISRHSPILAAVADGDPNVEYMVPHVLQGARDAGRAADDLTLIALQLP